MHVAAAEGVTLHAQELGPADGAPVVMLHGLLVGNMTTWYFSAAPELAKRHRVILFDLRGHGMSTRAKSGYDVATMTRDLEAVVEEVARGPVALVGHSYGATVALAYALRRPERVTKLAVVEAPLPPSRLDELEGFLGKSPDQMLGALPEMLRDAVVGGGRRGRRFVEAMRFLAQESTLFSDLSRAEDIADDALARLACPLLAVYGTGSSCLHVGRRLARVVPGAKLEEMPGGHFLPLERAAALTEVLARFVDG
jgi:pimeloyl-ACP methyl ester carboxylesterase